ncbi:hypothetical protein [Butyrivibrio sp. MB2005]|uniref:hypothetical protein n=1 Tax=Butyrivibrio sp. MB2005 TaxID=1280678 RepID=UPI000420BD2A|nr:hypothetical protein [Butyrivibrio sp. MB2005]
MGKMKKLLKTVACATLVFTLSMPMTVSANLSSVSVNKDVSNDGTTTYTNRANGKSYVKYADGTSAGDTDFVNLSRIESDKQMIRVGDINEVSIYPSYNQTISNVKVISGKKNLTAKISSKNITRNMIINCSQESDGRYYYKDQRTDEKIYTDSKQVVVTKASYSIRITGKKKGKAKISFQFNDINGNKVQTRTLKVSVVDNAKPVKQVTFGGKNVLVDMTDNSKYIYAGNSKNGTGYTTKKSGKLKVKMNKYARLKSIYMVTNTPYINKEYDKSYGYTTGYYAQNGTNAVDINGDGDFNDEIDGIKESASSDKVYKKIKNGSKVKLSNVPDSVTNTSITLDREEGLKDYSYLEQNSSNISTTQFIIIMQDKRTGEYLSQTVSIKRRISK